MGGLRNKGLTFAPEDRLLVFQSHEIGYSTVSVHARTELLLPVVNGIDRFKQRSCMLLREMKLAADRTLGHHRPAIATYFPTSIKLAGACDRPSRLRSLNASASAYTEGGPQDESRVSPPSANRRVVPPLSTVRVPHCGYHYDGAPRRFFEGWYWKVSGLLSG